MGIKEFSGEISLPTGINRGINKVTVYRASVTADHMHGAVVVTGLKVWQIGMPKGMASGMAKKIKFSEAGYFYRR